MSPSDVHHRLMSGRLPKLWIPSLRDFVRVDQIPITATGKIDLRALRELAMHAGRGADGG
jgi:acyl-[acyl-carrier-protein]-phospholipid O-acyltransferase / long-chain-fatty-acid--[acyl-carrier-protein] ligase